MRKVIPTFKKLASYTDAFDIDLVSIKVARDLDFGD